MAQDSARPDGRKKMTVYMRPELIETLKILAVKDNRYSYELVEDALQALLDERRSKEAEKN